MGSHTLRASASALTLSLAATFTAGAQTEAEPQQPSAEFERTLGTVTVTANRREENIQSTGSSVSALDSDALLERPIDSVEDVADAIPGLQVSTYQGDTSIFIRGIGTPVIIAGADSSTATYLDGVFLSRAAAIGPAFFDVERLEVLRGPQGTLYGRNATGGAVNIITK